MSPQPRRRRLAKDLFETRSHAWHSLGLGEELTPRFSKRQLGGLLVALLVIAGTLFVYYNRRTIAPGYGEWVRAGTVVVLVVVGSIATHWLGSGLTPRLYRRLDPATAGTAGFVIRLLAMAAVVILALRIAGVTASTLAVGGAFTAVLIGLAAQQALGGLFAGIVLQSTRPFRVGERVRLVGGALAGSLEGTVSSLGLFYTTLSQGADRLMVPWRSWTPTASSSASPQLPCEPKTAPAWPTRCWRPCGARNRLRRPLRFADNQLRYAHGGDDAERDVDRRTPR